MKERDMTRREFLERSGAVASVAAVGCSSDDSQSGGVADATSDTATNDAAGSDTSTGGPDTDTTPDATSDTADTQSSGLVPVAIVATGDDVLASVRRVIELAGGLDAIQPGDTVFIKPNAVHGFTGGAPAIVTDLALLKAVITIVRERQPASITVGDRSARFFDSPSVFDLTGMQAAALEAGADEVYPAPTPEEDPDAWVLVQPDAWEETWSETGGVLVMKRLVEADHIINLPVCKNHRWAGYSLAMKNFIGGIGDSSRDPMHYIEGDAERLSRDIAILNQPFSPLLNLVDATVALVNGGPEGVNGDDVRFDAGVLLASTDRIAVDAAGAALLQYGLTQVTVDAPDEVHARMTGDALWTLPQLVQGIERGLGISSAAEAELIFEGVDDALKAAIEARFHSA